MNMLVLRCSFLALLFVSPLVDATTFYEIGAGVGRYDLEITTRAPGDEDFFDESTALNLSLAAYRQFGEKTAFGGVVEVMLPVDRDDLPGSGQTIGLRPVNLLVYLNERNSLEFYGGAAQYEWRKTANGYYVGSNFRHDLGDSGLSVGVDLKYYWDINVDSPDRDDIVVGFYPLVKLFYRFK